MKGVGLRPAHFDRPTECSTDASARAGSPRILLARQFAFLDTSKTSNIASNNLSNEPSNKISFRLVSY
jgi:hypothetical protein